MAVFDLRRLKLADMDATAVVHRAAFDERLPWLLGLHTAEEDRCFFREHVFAACKVWGAVEHDVMVGIVAFREGWIDLLYVLPRAQKRGVGTALLDVARRSAAEVSLWTFQRNTAARRFYERHGFVAVEQTDGTQNEEREPDVLYRWSSPG